MQQEAIADPNHYPASTNAASPTSYGLLRSEAASAGASSILITIKRQRPARPLRRRHDLSSLTVPPDAPVRTVLVVDGLRSANARAHQRRLARADRSHDSRRCRRTRTVRSTSTSGLSRPPARKATGCRPTRPDKFELMFRLYGSDESTLRQDVEIAGRRRNSSNPANRHSGRSESRSPLSELSTCEPHSCSWR